MKSKVFLYVWVFAIIFPLAWFYKTFAPENQVFQLVFELDWTHIVAHFLLFVGLSVLSEFALSDRNANKRVGLSALRLLALVLVVATLQEGLQHLTHSTEPGILPSLFDLGVDLASSALGFVVIKRIRLGNWNFLKPAFVKG
ncbi:MAG TPA: hypothetical protein VMT46_15890 [Anaerolineaceae bacterium]|nr:hypothetical protein [Anaerolineaceae bacterium]